MSKIRSKTSKRTQRRCSLQDKIRYPSERRANRALDTLWKAAVRGEFRGQKMPCRAYKCAKCAGWHLTSQARREVSEA